MMVLAARPYSLITLRVMGSKECYYVAALFYMGMVMMYGGLAMETVF